MGGEKFNLAVKRFYILAMKFQPHFAFLAIVSRLPPFCKIILHSQWKRKLEKLAFPTG